ncbi:ferritin-like domain-containing protein [Belnapia rosea]|uniref:Ferritin-like metal-binding protein YciE n=1 Tax=Belnapia rosea TaxID=938405 RepID=A0A1G6TIY8_9PROT|nr:ferritin-like domain-containing protein [Belnapia rosea]SDB68844.1 Ferritin-like metal-binding protein YciE [Belnapia rosea]SDD29020.1 Ferritin-like metal-binding protein YciE [Belnapia rosea]
MENEIREMLVAQLKDIYSAEKQGVRNMQRIVRKVTAPELREALTMHVEQTQSQIERVEQALDEMGARPGRKVCEAMRGLVEEAQHELEEYEKGPILDIVIVAATQKIEHYEIASYGTTASLAKALGEQKIGDLLGQILEEEKQTDLKLTELTQSVLMGQVMSGEAAANDAKAAPKRKAS